MKVTSWFKALLVLMVFFIASCGQKNTVGNKKVFRLNYSSGALEAIDPAFAKDIYQIWTCHMVYNTLVETDSNLNITPSLAKSWDVSPDGLHFIFHLRGDVFFHDNEVFPSGKGRRMTAGDIVYSFSRVINPKVASPGAWIFNSHVDSSKPFEAINDTTFQLNLKHNFRPILQLLGVAYCNIVAKEVVEKWGKDYRSHPCGTGPFSFNYWDEGNNLALVKNNHYWEKDAQGKQLPYLDGVQISFIDSKASEFMMLRQGRIDFMNNIDGSFKDLIFDKNGNLKPDFKGKLKVEKNTYLNTEYIGFNTDTTNELVKNSPIKDRLVRQAINYAIDREKIVLFFKNNMCIPATHGFIPKGIQGYKPSADYGYKYNQAKAAELLQQAGYPKGKGLKPITFQVPDNLVDIVNYITTDLKAVGIPAKIETIQPNILKQQMSAGKVPVFRGNWMADYPDAETFLVVFLGSQPAPPNYTRFKNELYDRWYDAAISLPDSARYEMYAKMDSLAMSYAPLIPLYYDMRIHFLQNNITGFKSNAMNVISLKEADINGQ